MAPLIVEAVGHFVPDHAGDRAIIVGRIGCGIEDRRLKESGGEDDVAQRAVIGVVGLRGHLPVAAVDRPVAAAELEAPFVGGRTPDVADRIVALHHHRRIIARLVRIADLHDIRVEFLERFGLGLRSHPGERLDAVAECALDVGDQGFDLSLCFRRKITIGVKLAGRPVERAEAGRRIGPAIAARGGEHGSLPAHLLLGLARKRMAVQVEIGIGERLGHVGRGEIGDAEGHPRFQRLDPRLRHHRRQLGKSGIGGDDQALFLVEPGARQIRPPVEARRISDEIGRAHRIILGGRIALFGLGPACLGQPGLEGDDIVGRAIGVAPADQPEHLFRIIAIGGALRVEIGIQIIIPVGQAESALLQIDRIDVRVLLIAVDEVAERAGVETILPHQRGERRPIGRVADRIDLGRDRLGPGRLDRRLVHEGGIEGADLALEVGRFGRRILGRILQQLVEIGLGANRHFEAAAGRGLVGGDLGSRQIGAVGILEEVVAGLGGGVDRGQVEARGRIDRRRRLERYGDGDGRGERGGAQAHAGILAVLPRHNGKPRRRKLVWRALWMPFVLSEVEGGCAAFFDFVPKERNSS